MGWDIGVDVPCVHTLLLRHWLGFGWGWVITFMRLAHTRDATLLLRHWLGFGWGCFYPFWNMRINMYYIYMILLSLSHAVTTLRCEYYVSQIHNTLRCTLLLHTGSIDGMWKLSNGAVPTSWSTRKDGAVNPQLLQGIGIWQRRWHHGNCTDFLSLTGHALSKPLEK